MIKKLKKIILGVMVMSLLLPTVVYGNGDTPSDWAVEEVDLAIDNGLVREELQVNYKTSVKRYEYVALALGVLEKNGTYIEVVNEHPFSDINGHQYEEEIIKAYNIGVVKGDGNGLFRPNDLIKREEIATLITNLVKIINPRKITKINEVYDYSDAENISGWAKEYIDFCYSEDLMKGVGKNYETGLDTIDPKGKATIEQAIMLMYRLANHESVLNKYGIEELKLVIYDGENRTVTKTEGINDFAATVGIDYVNAIKAVMQYEDVELIGLSKDIATIKYLDNYITVQEDALNNIIISGNFTSFDDETALKVYQLLVNGHNNQVTVDEAINEGINAIKNESITNFNKTLDDGSNIKVVFEKIMQDTKLYGIKYQGKN